MILRGFRGLTNRQSKRNNANMVDACSIECERNNDAFAMSLGWGANQRKRSKKAANRLISYSGYGSLVPRPQDWFY